MGLAGGTTLPAITVLLSAWVPEKERGKLGGFVLGGTQVKHFEYCFLSIHVSTSIFSWEAFYHFTFPD